jgi:hypothetical protein
MNISVSFKTLFIFALLGLLFSKASGGAQSSPDNGLLPQRPKVFLNGPEAAFYQKEIPFVEHVQDRKAASVQVDVTAGRDAEGDFFALVFDGFGEFEGLRDSLKYRPVPGESAEDSRRGIAQILKLGLMRFVHKTATASRVDISLQASVKPTAVVDPWNFWVFSLGANAMLNGETSYQSRMWMGNLSAGRVTPDWKIRFGVNLNSEKNSYSYDGFDYESASNYRSFQSLIVRSLSDHWSVGATASASSSSYDNSDFNLVLKPAVEFDVYPYSESTKRQLRILYAVGPNFVRYHEETIFDKKKETLWSQSLSISLELLRPWGSANVTLAGSNYFHDLKKNRLDLNGGISWRIFQGLNFNIDGGGARVRDQLSLSKGGASLEEVLLRRRQLATGYNYFFSVGLSYTFGSVDSNIVNPRFGSGGGGFMVSF